MAAKTVGFVGLGLMGLPMARNVIRGGHVVTGFDLDPDRMRELRQGGGRSSDSAAGAAEGADLVITMVPNPEHVEDAVLGRDGIAERMPKGGLVVVMSTIDPFTARKVHSRLSDRGVEMIEAPVTLSSTEAENGTLGILVGGDEALYEDALPVLQCMGKGIKLCGPVGAGSAVKLVNNMLALCIQVSTAEALVLGVKAGPSIDTMYEVFRTTAAWNRPLESAYPDSVFRGDYSPGFMSKLAQKDLRLATAYASELGAITPMGNQAHHMMTDPSLRGFADENATAVAKLYEEAAGVKLRR